MTRAEHLQWCKNRALEYLDSGDLGNAMASMLSDMDKHDETRLRSGTLVALGILYCTNNDAEGMRRWIEGFN